MITVQLIDVRIDAAHGLYAGEENVGNPYIVNLDVSFDEVRADLHKLSGTIDYVTLYEMVRAGMQVPSKLLENLCDRIIGDLKSRYPFIQEVKLSIQKIQAPIKNLQGKVGVTMNKKFDD